MILLSILTAWGIGISGASTPLEDAARLYESGQFFESARYAFSVVSADSDPHGEAYALITAGLIRAGLAQSSSYFFIKTLESKNKSAIRKVLPFAPILIQEVGLDLFRKYLLRYTDVSDYSESSRNLYSLSLMKEYLLSGRSDQALSVAGQVSKSSTDRPLALHLKGSALALMGQSDQAFKSFEECVVEASRQLDQASDSMQEKRSRLSTLRQKQLFDLRSRCLAGQARTLYEMGQFDLADRIYDQVPKSSFVWTDTLFEHAWNSFAKTEYNRVLGKLVSYKSPSLQFVFNSEVDVLRAQAFLALCLYSDANEVVNEFNRKYSPIAEEVKKMVEQKGNDFPFYYSLGSKVLKAPLHSENQLHRMMNRFVRSPYFQVLKASESEIVDERSMIARFDREMRRGVSTGQKGFPGFLNVVLDWRQQSVEVLGGVFVKNSLIDYHSVLIADFEKIAFIKLEMLSRAKEELMTQKPSLAERARGNLIPKRRDDQYRWNFNGEFWNDEIGDYVFALESECRGVQ